MLKIPYIQAENEAEQYCAQLVNNQIYTLNVINVNDVPTVENINIIVDEDSISNIILFGNASIFGGIIATNSNNEIINDYTCYVNNIKCHAAEAKFGGIVITPTQRDK